MTTCLALDIITERLPDCSPAEVRKAWQTLVDNGKVWSMPPKYGHIAATLIASGIIERNPA